MGNTELIEECFKDIRCDSGYEPKTSCFVIKRHLLDILKDFGT